jgi:hypothetical protein
MVTRNHIALLSIVASLSLAACGGSSGDAPAASKPAEKPAAGQPAAEAITAPAEQAPPASKYRLPKDFELSEEQVELPGIPLYPGSATLSLPGIGPRMGGNSDKGSATTVQYVLEDGVKWQQVRRFYLEKLEADGWKQIDAKILGEEEDLPIGMLTFEKEKRFVSFRYGDSTQTKASPLLNVIYTAEN